MGYEKLEDVIGRADFLKYRSEAKPAKTLNLDLSFITEQPDVSTNRGWVHLDEKKRVVGFVLGVSIPARIIQKILFDLSYRFFSFYFGHTAQDIMTRP